MFFKGGTRLQHNCSEFSKSWLNFEAEIDPKNVMIPIGENLKSADDAAFSAFSYPATYSSDLEMEDEIVLRPYTHYQCILVYSLFFLSHLLNLC